MDIGKENIPEKSFMGDSTESIDNPLLVDALLEESEDEEVISEENREYSELIGHVNSRFRMAKIRRRAEEERWLSCYRNYRGLYGPDVQFSDTEKSRAFIKITKTKVLAAYSKITEVLFSGRKFPIGVEPTPVPEGIEKDVHIDMMDKESGKGEGKDENKQPSTISRSDIFEKLGGLKKTLEKLPEDIEVKEGVGKTPNSHTFSPAEYSARKMEDKMHDQLEESNASEAVRAFAFEKCLFGSGIIKGPLANTKEYPRWNEEGDYDPVKSIIAEISHTSIWNNYPDPDARSVNECEDWIERHRMSKTQLRKLKKRPFFRPESIEIAIEQGPNYVNEDWELVLKDNDTDVNDSASRFEVLEYWGTIDRQFIEDTGFIDEIPEKYQELDEFAVNIWICNNSLLRLVLNPFNPIRIPYYACPYELNPYSIFGVGVAENMLDSQLIMNGFFRLAIDNAVLSSNVIFEIDETNLAPGQDLKVHPGKVFRRQGGAPGQSLFATKYPNVTNECMALFDKARQLADESTGMPSYAHGISGIMSTGRTASGMSMLMEAADENIKSVIRNIDDYLLVPLGKALFAFNMQFDFDPEIQGDLDVIALGTESLMRNEVRSQKLLQFLQLTTNDIDAPFVKREYILRELAHTLDLDSDKVVNDSRAAAIQASMIKDMRGAMGGEGKPMAQAPGVQGIPGVGGGAGPQSAPVAEGAGATPDSPGFTGGTPPNLGAGGAV